MTNRYRMGEKTENVDDNDDEDDHITQYIFMGINDVESAINNKS